CPSHTYDCPTLTDIFGDKLYGSFAFVPHSQHHVEPAVRGRVIDASGRGKPGQRVDLVRGSATYHTITGQTGKFEFYESVMKSGKSKSRTAKIKVNGTSRKVQLGSSQLI